MKKTLLLFLFFTTPALANFENMCGVDGYSGFNAVFVPYTQEEFDNSSLESGDTFTCLANNRRIFNAVFVPNEYDCAAGYYVPANNDGCVPCPADSYCPGGHYVFNETMTQGATACADGLHTPAGMWESDQCGRILHIGENVIYMRSTRKTIPSFNIKVGNDIFYGNMTTADVPMSATATQKLKVKLGDTIYSVYDDSINPGE